MDLNPLRTVEQKLESNRDIPRRFFAFFLLYLLIYLKARRKNGGKPETFRDIPRRSEVLDFRRFDSGFRSKFETDRDIPRHSGALDFRRFDSSFRSAVRCGLRSTLRGAPRAKNNPRARGRYIYIYTYNIRIYQRLYQKNGGELPVPQPIKKYYNIYTCAENYSLKYQETTKSAYSPR